MELQQVQALALLAGLGECTFEQIANGYWPHHPDYADMRKLHPWWRIKTNFGTIVIGWRKRVIQIDWKDTNRRGIVTDSDTTKDVTMVHAWSIGEALGYLKAIPSLPIVDVTLPQFKDHDCTVFKDIDFLIRRFTDTTTLEHKLMVQILGTVDPETTPIRLSVASKAEGNSKDRFVLHVGDLRIEWMTRRNV